MQPPSPFGPMSYPGINPPDPNAVPIQAPQPIIGPMPPAPFFPNVNAPIQPPQQNPIYVQPDSTNPAQIQHAIQSPPGAEQDNQNPDIFTDIKNMVGGAFGAIGSALDADKHWVVHPIYEGLLHPDQVLDAGIQFWNQPDHSLGSYFNLINEQYQNNQDAGIEKFAGDIAFDPLTYLSSGVLKAAQVGGDLTVAGKTLASIPGVADIPVAGEALAKSMDPLIYGAQKYEQGVDAVASGLSNFATGIATNQIALTAAKDAARGTLQKVLPDGLVENILNTIPDEYNGVPIGPIADSLNKMSGDKLGLPRIIQIPQYRMIQTAQAYSQGFNAARLSLAQGGINYADANTNPSTLLRAIRYIYTSDAASLSPEQRWTQDIIKRSAPPTTAQIKVLNSAVGGTLNDPSLTDQLAINNTLQQFRRGPTVTGASDGIDEGSALNSLAQIFGVNPKANPEAIGELSRYLNQRSDDAAQFMSSLEGLSPMQVTQQLAFRAQDMADAQFSMGVAAQRMQNTWMDQMLTGFDSNVYKPIWQGFINKYISRPLVTFGVDSLGMQFMQPAEAYLRHLVEGGGSMLPITPEQFGKRTAGIDGVPPLLQKLTPPHYSEDDQSILDHMAEWDNPIGNAAAKFTALQEWSRNFSYNARLSYWLKTYDGELQSARDAAGITARPDTSAFLQSAGAPLVQNTPELAGVDQNLVNDAYQQMYSNPGNTANLQNIKNNLQVGQIAQTNLSQVVDGDTAMNNLSPSSRALLRKGLMTAENTEDVGNAVDAAIANEKKLLIAQPQAQAELFQGSLDQLKAQMNYPMNSPADLQTAVNMVNAMHLHASNVPDLMNQAEQDGLRNVQGASTWRRNIHTQYSNQLQATLDKISPILDEAYEVLGQQGEKFGLRPDVEAITANMKTQRDLLFSTLQEQNKFQKEFFDLQPNRQLDATWNDPITGYYPRKDKIWQGFNGQKDALQATIQQQQIDLANKIGQAQAAGIMPGPVNTLGNAMGQAKAAAVEITPQEILSNPNAIPSPEWTANPGQQTAQMAGHDITITRSPTTKRWSFDVTKPGEAVPLDRQFAFNVTDSQANLLQRLAGDNPDVAEALNGRDGPTVSMNTRAVDHLNGVLPNTNLTDPNDVADLGYLQNRISENVKNRWTQPATEPTILTQGQGRFSNIESARAAAEDYVRNATAPEPIHPDTQRFSNIITTGLASGDSPEEIAYAINHATLNGESSAGEESAAIPSSTAVQSQVSGAIDNDTLNAGGNDASVGPTISAPDPNSFLGTKYANLDTTVRQGLNDEINARMANPGMTDQAYQYLSDKLDNIYREYSGMPDEVKHIMDDAQRVAVSRTNQKYEQAFTNYDSKNNFDAMMLHFVPFWMHESRRWPWLARTFLGKPTLASMWTAYQDNTDQGYVPLRDTPIVGGLINALPSGNSWQVNPFRLVSPFNPIQPANQFRPAYFTGGIAGAMQNIDQTLSQLGINPSEMFDIPQALAEGQPGTLEPPMMKSAIDIARGSNVPGLTQLAAGIQKILPDNYRDYYTRMILASQGFKPDDIYNKALDDDETAKNTLDLAQEQSSLVTAVLAQSGVLRYRTPEWSQYQQARQEAVASMTGLSSDAQSQLRNQGISIQQVEALSPLQREELANVPGAKEFNQISEPLLNPAAQRLRKLQNDFYSTIDAERTENNQDQSRDDQRFQNGLISGVEWRRRYQDRAQSVSNLIDDLKKSPAYANVPVSSDEQAQARARFNLPPFVQSPEDILLNQYYGIKPTEDPITGDINFSDFFDKRQALLDQHPDLQAVLNAKLAANNTVQVVDFKRASETLRPYFSIPDQITAQHPEIQGAVSQLKMLANTDPIAASRFREMHPEIATLNKIIRQTQQQARQRFPQIDQALVKYYGATPIDYQTLKKGPQ